VVANRDFGELTDLPPGPCSCRRAVFQASWAQLQTKIEHLDRALEDHADELAAGEFVVVGPGKFRVAGPSRF
jgi:hypothetical protein